MDFDDRIRKLGDLLRGYVDAQLIDFFVEYVDLNEPGIALDTIVAHICDNDIPLTQQDVDEIFALQRKMGITCKSDDYLKGLIR